MNFMNNHVNANENETFSLCSASSVDAIKIFQKLTFRVKLKEYMASGKHVREMYTPLNPTLI